MAILTTTDPTGVALTPQEFGKVFLTMLIPQSVGLSSGFQVLQTDRDSLYLPAPRSDVQAAWTAEAAEIAVSDPTADSVVAVPRKLASLTYVSNEAFDDSEPGIGDLVMESIARQMSLKLDLGFFEGTGTAPVIRGLKNVAGIQSVSMGANGAALTNLDPVADALGMLREVDAVGSAVVMHPRTWRQLTKLKEQASGSNKPLLAESAGSPTGAVGGPSRGDSVGSVYGVPVWLSSQLAINETQGTATAASSIYVYEANQVYAVMRNGTTINVDPSVKFSSDQVAIRGKLRADMVVPYPKSVVRIVGVL